MRTETPTLTRADVLNAALARFDYSQTKLAAALGQAAGTISRWKNGLATPEEGRCLRLAKMTGFSPAEVLRAFGYDPDPLGITSSPPTAPAPTDYDLRLALRIADGLAKFADDVKAMISTSQSDYDPQALSSDTKSIQHYGYQRSVPIGPSRITRMGDRLRALAA